MIAIRCATVVELRLQQISNFYKKLHFTVESVKFREAVKCGLNIFAPNYQKAHPYAASGRTNHLAYGVSDVVLTLYGGEKKSMRESLHRYCDVVIFS